MTLFVEGYDDVKFPVEPNDDPSLNTIGVCWNVDFPPNGRLLARSYSKLMRFPSTRSILGLLHRWSCAFSTPLEEKKKNLPLFQYSIEYKRRCWESESVQTAVGSRWEGGCCFLLRQSEQRQSWASWEAGRCRRGQKVLSSVCLELPFDVAFKRTLKQNDIL